MKFIPIARSKLGSSKQRSSSKFRVRNMSIFTRMSCIIKCSWYRKVIFMMVMGKGKGWIRSFIGLTSWPEKQGGGCSYQWDTCLCYEPIFWRNWKSSARCSCKIVCCVGPMVARRQLSWSVNVILNPMYVYRDETCKWMTGHDLQIMRTFDAIHA
jgi:hypothetical protein